MRLLLLKGAWARAADHCGKCPLHDAAWAGSAACGTSWTIIKMLLDWDESLLRAADRHGFTPLDYVKPHLYDDWKRLLTANADVWWHPSAAPGMSPDEWAQRLWDPASSKYIPPGPSLVTALVPRLLIATDRPDGAPRDVGVSSARSVEPSEDSKASASSSVLINQPLPPSMVGRKDAILLPTTTAGRLMTGKRQRQSDDDASARAGTGSENASSPTGSSSASPRGSSAKRR